MSQEKFEALAQEISSQASSVKCSKEDYIDGLRLIIQTLQTDIEAAEEF